MRIGPYGGLLAGLTHARAARSGRASSWDQSGRNEDAWIIMPGETALLADLEGPGCITHIWMTQFCRRAMGPGLFPAEQLRKIAPAIEVDNSLGVNWEVNDPDYYRKMLLRITWDDQPHPSVLVPLGDFFGIGHSIAGNYASLPFTVSARESERNKFGGAAALNCYLQMPFNRRARIEIENQSDLPYGQYFYIDYELYPEPLSDDSLYFHAQWRRSNPCPGWGPEIEVNSPEANTLANRDGAGNYVILEAEGRGHYVGCNLSVAHFQGTWWGEGDDMIFVDGETWPPSLHGTGSEDYFGQAWGMQGNAFPMNGSALYDGDVPGYQVSYRFHLVDPVRFSESIRVTMEHGHANHLADDWSSTAYWYQTLPGKPFDILPVEQRLPLHRAAASPEASAAPAPLVELSDEMRQIKAAWQARYDQWLEARGEQVAQRAADVREFSRGNVEQAHRVRQAASAGRRRADCPARPGSEGGK